MTPSLVLVALSTAWAFGWAIHALLNLRRAGTFSGALGWLALCAANTIAGAFLLCGLLWLERIREALLP